MVILRSLGTAEIDTGKTLLVPTHTVTFAATLYLVLERARKVSRAELASILWPDVDLERRGHRLRQTILQLKRLGLPLTVDRNSVSIHGDIAYDIDGVREGRDLLQIPSLAFLPGYDPTFSALFVDWLDRRRAGVHAGITEQLTTKLSAARAHGDWTETRLLGNKCLEVDSVNETAVLALAEEAVMRGGKREGVAILDKYLEEIGTSNNDIRLPATVLRRRIKESVPEPTPSLSVEPPFLGRETEMEWLLKRLEIAQSGSAVACVLVGEAGIGKTRLCTEFLKFASLQGVRVQRVGCRPADVDRPLSVFVDLVPALREMPGALGCAETTLVDLKRLTEYDPQPDQTFAPSNASDAFGRIRFAVYDLFDALTEEQCVLIAVDDAQWLDPASVKMLAGIAQKCRFRKLLFLLSSRPTPELLSSRIDQRVESLSVTPLTRHSASALLSSFALEKTAVEQEAKLTEWCLTVGEGNPFFLQELAKQCVQVGSRDTFPPSITKVVSDRLSRLPDASLHVLQACAVLADNSTLSRVERMLGYKPFEFIAAVGDLYVQGMLSPDPDSSNRAVPSSFLRSRHDLLSSAALGRLGPPALAYLHRRAGMILEEELSSDRPATSMLWSCAVHWHNAGDRERALQLTRSCAEHLLEVGLAADAVRAFERSLEYCSIEEQRMPVLSRYATALQLNGEWERSKGPLSACQTYHKTFFKESTLHNGFELRFLDVCRKTAEDRYGLVPLISRCVNAEDASPDHRVQAAAIALKIASDFGPSEVFDKLYFSVERFLTDRSIDRVSAMEVQMIYHTLRGSSVTALAAADCLVEEARNTKQPLFCSVAMVNRASAYRIAGRRIEAREFLDEALRYCRQHRIVSQLPSAYVLLLRLHLDDADLPNARFVMSELADYPPAKEDRCLFRIFLYSQTRFFIEEGDVRTASLAFQRYADWREAFPSSTDDAEAMALETRLVMAQNGPRQSLQPAVEQLQLYHERVRSHGLQDFETASLVRGFCGLGEHDRARDVLASYLVTHRRSLGPPARELARLAESLAVNF